MAAGRLKTSSVIIVLFGRLGPGVAQNQRSVADMTGIVDGDRLRGGITEPMRRNATPKGRLGLVDDPAR